MMTDNPPATIAASQGYSREALQDLVFINEQSSTRQPVSKFLHRLILATAFGWSFFQLWVASPFNYSFPLWANALPLLKDHGISMAAISGDAVRAIHLAFAMLLAFLSYPARKRSPRRYVPVTDWAFALLAAGAALYCFFYSGELAMRAGRPIERDVVIAWVGIILLLESTRRSLGLPMVVTAAICIAYAYFGHSDLIPDALRHKGHSISKIANHLWLSQEGVFGIALGVSASFVFLFVLFGSLLEKAGAGNYFIRIAFSLLGQLRGGPAKAAVVASGLTGFISASSIANVVTTGTFTIPLMKRAGFSAEKAGAIEVAAGVDGQIMPPVMGAAAFLMVEYTGVSYPDVIRHAFLPAILSYAALLYIVHLEALKSGARPVFTRADGSLTGKARLIRWGIILSSMLIVAGAIYYAITGIKALLGDAAGAVMMVVLVASYLLLIRYASRFPDIEMDDPNKPIQRLPNPAQTVKAGLYYLLPIGVLVWCLMIEHIQPGTSAFWATCLLAIIMATQYGLKAWFRKEKDIRKSFRTGIVQLREGLVSGAQNMIGIGTATAAAGIVIGIISLTGVGNVMVDFVDSITGNSLFLLLLFTAIICLLLGMGMPTTASYIIVAALMAPIVRELGMRNGLDVPLIAIHLFVFYFGIMADVTPPVGLASFAAAAISGADPFRTGIVAFTYCMRTAMLPFFFIYNTELLMFGVNGFAEALWVMTYSITGILLFCTVLQRFFLVRNTIVETVMLLVASLIIMVPNVCNNWINPPYKKIDMQDFEHASFTKNDAHARMRISGIHADEYGDIKRFQFYIPVTGESNVSKVLKDYGLSWRREGWNVVVSEVRFGSRAYTLGMDDTYVISKIRIPQEQPDTKIMYIPALLLVGFVLMSQLARRRKEAALGMLK